MLFLGISLSCIALYLGALAGLIQWTAWGLWGLGGIAFVMVSLSIAGVLLKRNKDAKKPNANVNQGIEINFSFVM